MLRTSLASALVVAALALTVEAPAAGPVEVVSDNDTDGLVPGPGATDRGYTQGTRITWTARTDRAPLWAWRIVERVPGIGSTARSGVLASRRFGVAVGQEIYTPEAISQTQAIPNDQPYAGWLYAGAFAIVEDARRQHTLELRAGTSGPRSLAADVQSWWHRTLAIRRPRGWSHQLRNELGLIVCAEERWRLFGPQRYADMIPHLGASVGNVRTEAWAGMTLRAGLPLPADFGPSSLGLARQPQSFHLYVFARAEGRAVAHDMFLDGNTFVRGPRVTRLPWVGETQLGAGVRWHRVGLRYMFSFTTAQFRERPQSHEYGSIGVSF